MDPRRLDTPSGNIRWVDGCRCITADMICRPTIFIFRTYQHSELPRAYSIRTDAGTFG
jgi:hypothetical protein